MHTSSPWFRAGFVVFAVGCSPANPPIDAASDVSPGTDASVDATPDTAPDSPPDVIPAGPVRIMMDFTRTQGFYTAPFPSEDRRRTGDVIDMTGFPNPRSASFVVDMLGIIARDVRGFGTTSAIYFKFDGPTRSLHLPTRSRESLQPDASIVLVPVDAAAPDRLVAHPVKASFSRDPGPYGSANLLSVLPEQGVPLRPSTLYAAVVLRSASLDPEQPLQASPEVAALAQGTAPAGLSGAALADYMTALTALRSVGPRFAPDQIAGLAVFRTEDPTETFNTFRADALGRTQPSVNTPFVRTDVFPDYCVYQTTIDMPDYQEGTPPYNETGSGSWKKDSMGRPIVQRQARANFVATVPRKAMPANGFPIVLFSRTGGGGERPLVDRGVHATAGGPAVTPGSGPAIGFAKAGYAGASIDGPHGGLRNVTHSDEQFLVFNVTNPVAMRDNVRQSALELDLASHILEGVSINLATTGNDCPGVTIPGGGTTVRYDTATTVLMGHSTGALISSVAMGFEPKFRAAILSGAGGSWVENIVYKLKPVPVRPAAEIIVKYTNTDYHLNEFDPVVALLLQWAGESADPPVYNRYTVREVTASRPPRHVLMLQGITDHYIMPPIANPMSLSLGLDLAGTEIDNRPPELMSLPGLGGLVDLVDRHTITLPAQGNLLVNGQSITAVVVQHPEDGIEDGHEVVFQTEAPKYQYRCFLSSLLTGVPSVPGDGRETDPCP